MKEKLYNGIELPDEWPPKNFSHDSNEPMPVPYLDSPPGNIPIDVGRQFFVDDFLVEKTGMQRVFHQPEKNPENPLVKPERDYEASSVYLVGEPALWDAYEQNFKMWYAPGHWIAPRALLVSSDGINWKRPETDVKPPTNIVMHEHERFAICSVLPDYKESDRSRRFKAYGWEEKRKNGHRNVFLSSSDGIHWREEGRWKDTFSQDTTNIFFNPFREKWVYNPKIRGKGRSRGYAEVDSFEELMDENMVSNPLVKWLCSDELDDTSSELEETPIAQIYDLFAAPYESIMLGAVNVWYGPENNICEERKIPKLLQIQMGYSRDGFHWHRPVREPFIPAVRDAGPGHPEYGYLRPAGSVVNVVKDKLFFYYMAASGIDKNGRPGVYTGITINLATLRRDGFASMRAGEREETLLTRPVTFSGRHLFVNVDNPGGALAVEVCSEAGEPLPGFGKTDCIPVAADSTKTMVEWKGKNTMEEHAGRPVRFRFCLTDGDLYAFWVSGSQRGESGGYVAGSGPGFENGRDV